MKYIFTTLIIFTLLTSPFTQQTAHAVSPAPVLQTGQTLCYDSVGTVIDCAGTGQDGDLNSGVTWPSPRFSDLSDGTVTDNLTGLTWSKDGNSSGAAETWQNALDFIKTLNISNYRGHNDWRLPNINELESLVNYSLVNSATWLNGQGFSDVQSGNYWSATPSSYNNGYALHVKIDTGLVEYYLKSSNYYVWPVRDGLSGSMPGTSTLPKTGQTICSNDAYKVVACAGSGQDGEFLAGIAWPSPRFTTNTDLTITDNVTGLIWSKDGNPGMVQKNWQGALDYIKTLNSSNYRGQNDWRLPNINELKSLQNQGQPRFATWLNAQGFSNVQLGSYWSGSVFANDTRYALFAAMDVVGTFSIVGGGSKASNGSYFYVWPVRSGQAIPVAPYLSVVKSGTGSGVVSSSTGGINCGSACSASIANGTLVILTATPDNGNTFTGWTGACNGTGTCTITMDVAKSVTATFALIVINGVCGSANAQSFAIAPNTNLCSSGTSTTITYTGTGPWNWRCNSVYCSANNQQASISKCGDCNIDGMVNISEVQKSISNFLGQ